MVGRIDTGHRAGFAWLRVSAVWAVALRMG